MMQYHYESVYTHEPLEDFVLLSTRAVPAVRTNGGAPDNFPNLLIYCPDCGTSWLKIVLRPAAGWPRRTWKAQPESCAKCGGTGEIIPLTLYAKDLAQPRALLCHDIERLTEYLIKRNQR